MNETTDPAIVPLTEALSLAGAALAAAADEHQRLTAEHVALVTEHAAVVDAFTADPTDRAGKEALRARDAAELAGHRLTAARARLDATTVAEEQARAALDLGQRKIKIEAAHAAARVPVLVAALAPVVALRRQIAQLEARARDLTRTAVDTFNAAAREAGIRLPFTAASLAAEILIDGQGPADLRQRFDRLGIGPGHALDSAAAWTRFMAGDSVESIVADALAGRLAAAAAALARDVVAEVDPIAHARAAAAELHYHREHALLTPDREHALLTLIADALPLARTATDRNGPGFYLLKRGATEERIGLAVHVEEEAVRVALLLHITAAELAEAVRFAAATPATPTPADAAPAVAAAA